MQTYSFKQRFILFLAGNILPVLIYLFGLTWRVRYINREAENCGPPLIWGFWHSRMLPLIYYYRKREIVVFVSRSFDGEVISRVLHKMGFRTVRGSTSRGAVQSLKAAVRELKSGAYVAITPDGPRGPAEIAQQGAAAACALADVPMVAVVTAASSKWRLSSWDRFVIPKPFSKIEIRQCDPIYSEKRTPEQLTSILQTELDTLTKAADDSVMGKLC